MSEAKVYRGIPANAVPQKPTQYYAVGVQPPGLIRHIKKHLVARKVRQFFKGNTLKERVQIAK